MWSLKPERWGPPLVQEKYQEEKACDKRQQEQQKQQQQQQQHNNNNNNNNSVIGNQWHLFKTSPFGFLEFLKHRILDFQCDYLYPNYIF